MSAVTGVAEIEARLSGIESVLAGLKQTETGVDGVAQKGSKVEAAFKRVGSEIGSVIKGGLTAAGILGGINLARAVEDAKRLDQTTAKFAQSSGLAAGQVKSQFEGMERRALTAAPALAEFTKTLGRATYDGKAAAAAVGDLADEALGTGRDLSDELDLGKTLRSGLGVTKDFGAELGRIRDIAERVGTVGGHLALKDSLAALQPQLQQVAIGSDDARAKVESLVAMLGKGLKPGMQAAVAGEAFSMLKARALDIERATGKRVVNDLGELIDPTQTLADLQKLGERKFGKNKEAARRAAISDFGMDLGLAIYRTDFSQVGTTAARARDTGKTADQANQYRDTAAARRVDLELQKDAAQRQGGEAMLAIQDKLIGTLGANTTALLELGLSLRSLSGILGGAGGGAAAGAAGSAAGTAAGAAGKSTLGSLITASLGGVPLLPIAAMGAVGYLGYRDIMSEAPAYEAARGRKKAQENQADAAGMDALSYRIMSRRLPELQGEGGLQHPELAEAMQTGKPIALDQREVVDAIRNLPKELTTALQTSPMVLRLPEDPNKPKAKGSN